MEMSYCPFFQWETVFSYVHVSREPWPLHGCRGLPHLVICRPAPKESELFIINDKHFFYWLVIQSSVTNRKILWLHFLQCVHRQFSIVLCCYGKWNTSNCQLQLTKGKEKKEETWKKSNQNMKRTESYFDFI